MLVKTYFSCAFTLTVLAMPQIVRAAPTKTNTLAAAPTVIASTISSSAVSDEALTKFTIGDTTGLSGRIFFSAKIEGFQRILMLDLDSRKIRKVIDGPGNNISPETSPDGKLVAFVSDRDGNREIYLVDWEGSNARRLTTNNYFDDKPVWSPDGTKIAYQSELLSPEGSFTNVFSIKIDGGTPSNITRFAGKNTSPDWSPDSNSMLFHTNRYWPGGDICTVGFANRQENCMLKGKSNYDQARWNHAGTALLVAGGELDKPYLSIYDVSAATERLVVSLTGKISDLNWSPDDSHIIFSSDHETKDVPQIYFSDLEGHLRTLLTSDYPLLVRSWSKFTTINLEGQKMKDQDLLDTKNSEESKEKALASATPR